VIPYIGLEEIIGKLGKSPRPEIIGIDGYPCSGKSTLVEMISSRLECQCIYLDDFVLPESEWSSLDTPGFPFSYIRYQEFLETVRSLFKHGTSSYYPFDWESGAVSSEPKTIHLKGIVIVEGVSALNLELCPYYDLRIFVESDLDSLFDTAKARGFGPWEQAWKKLFLPSVELYMETRPRERADALYAGRGAKQ
jgi:uridine kinase